MNKLSELFFEQTEKIVDKWEQYLGVYDAEFFSIISSGKPIRLLEIGVQNGGSLELWEKYLPPGSYITGVDIEEKCGSLKFESPNISVHVLDAADPYAAPNLFAGQIFDVIIDDGSHISSDIIATFGLMYPFLALGGKYVIEDLECSYYKTHEGGLRYPRSSIEWLKGLVDVVNADHIQPEDARLSDAGEITLKYRKSVGRITFYDSVAVIEKLPALKDRPFRRMLSGQQSSVVPAFELLARQPQSVYGPMFYGAAAAKEMDGAIVSAYEAARAALAGAESSAAAMRSALEGDLERSKRTTASLYEILAVKDAHIATLNADLAWRRGLMAEQDAALQALGAVRSENEQLAFRVKALFSLIAILEAQGTPMTAWSAGAVKFSIRSRVERPGPGLSPGEMRARAASQQIDALKMRSALLASAALDEKYRVRALALGARLLTRRVERYAALIRQFQALLGRPLRLRAWQRLRRMLRPADRHESLVGAPLPDPVTLDGEDVALLADSGLFDPAFYRDSNPDVASSDADPLEHFLASGGIEGRDPNVRFGTEEYWAENPDVAEARVNPLVHFVQSGAREGRPFRSSRATGGDAAFEPSDAAAIQSVRSSRLLGGTAPSEEETYNIIQSSGLFDPIYYAAANPDLDARDQDLLLHYVSKGWKEGRDPSATFKATFYRDTYMHSSEASLDPVLHFIVFGAVVDLPTSPEAFEYRAEGDIDFRDVDVAVALIAQSRLFDADQYRALRPDLGALEGDEIRHYVLSGAAERLDPCADFSTSAYVGAYPDVPAAGINPFLHFILYGAKEGRLPKPAAPPREGLEGGQFASSSPEADLIRESGLFDDEWYRAHYDDVRTSGADPFVHFMRHGLAEGRKPNAMFEPVWYRTFYADVEAAGAIPLLHYVQWGAFEGRSPCAGFDGQWYLEQNPDVVSSGENPLKHYMRIGRQEGRLPFDPDAAYRELVLRDRQLLVVERDELLRHVEMMQISPRFVIFIEGSDAALRARTRESVARQLYPKHEVLAAERISDLGEVARHGGDAYLLWLSEGDLLHERALYEFANEINADPMVDLLYGDEDRMSGDQRTDPFFKPDWSPDYLESLNYIGAAGCFRMRDAWEDLVGALSCYDFVLRFTERHSRAAHLRKVLCHVHRQAILSGDTGLMVSSEKALLRRLERTGRRASVQPIVPGRACFDVKSQSGYRPLVSIVVPTAGRSATIRGASLDLLSNCIEKIEATSTYPNIEFVIVDNGDLGAERADALERRGCKRVTFTEPKFNVAKKLNLGAREASGELLLLLNDDVEPLVPDWIERLVEHFEKDHVGVVGSKLLYPDFTTQHVGVVLNAGIPDHVRRLQPRSDDGYFFSTSAARNFVAVTGACMMTRASTFSDVGGYTEALAINYNDVDYCLKVIESGKTIVYAPKSELIHFESQSREARMDADEITFFEERWAHYAAGDPFYNERTLTVASPTFEIANNPRRI